MSVRILRHKRIHLRQVAGLWLQRGILSKRSIDIAIAAPITLAMLPLWMICGACIKLETRGPVFFRQERVGKDGQPFTMFKLRSMVADAEQRRDEVDAGNEMEGGVLFKMRNDPRLTRVGAFLRRWSLDETPQFLNVLTGDMSVVGPRPPLPQEVAEYLPHQKRRLKVKPGLTCLWQISGRSEIPFERQVNLDITYMHTRTLWLDLKIIAQTIPAVVKGRGAF